MHEVKKIPYIPIIVIDDAVIFGQYAHSEIPAALGFWGIVYADVEKLLAWAYAENTPVEQLGRNETATLRLIQECVLAMRS